jgi:hypothetical protein
MTTISKEKTKTETASASNVLDVATSIAQEILLLHDFYAKRFPYEKGKLIKDIGLLLLFDMTAKICFEFYEMIDNKKVERLSYSYIPKSVPGAVNSAPDDFPRREIQPAWQVRVVSYYPDTKPEGEVREFYEQLGWLPVDPLTRTGRGTTQEYGAFVSGGYSVSKEIYIDSQDKHHTDRKERAHETN